MENEKLVVAEYFYSLQGEGFSMGRPAIFLRLGGCNLLCGGSQEHVKRGSTWTCDTIPVWQKGRAYTFESLVHEMIDEIDFVNRLQQGVRLIITGGEPLLQQEKLTSFLRYLDVVWFADLPYVEIETNGTIEPCEDLMALVTQWNISPKLSNSGEPAEKRKLQQWFIEEANGENLDWTFFTFKFVVDDKTDLMELSEMLIQLPKRNIWLMPAADTREQLLAMNKFVAELAIKNGMNFSSRLQLEIWDKTTGV